MLGGILYRMISDELRRESHPGKPTDRSSARGARSRLKPETDGPPHQSVWHNPRTHKRVPSLTLPRGLGKRCARPCGPLCSLGIMRCPAKKPGHPSHLPHCPLPSVAGARQMEVSPFAHLRQRTNREHLRGERLQDPSSSRFRVVAGKVRKPVDGVSANVRGCCRR